MYIFNLVPTSKSVTWFESNEYDLKAMSAALSMLFAEVEPGAITRKIKLTVQIVEGSDESSYLFKSNKIWLCDVPDERARSRKKQEQALFLHLLHEFRHWMQCRIYKVAESELAYSDEDVIYNRHAYFRNEYEIDARRFSKQHLSKFYKYYKAFKH
jgi:hypothetical protein